MDKRYLDVLLENGYIDEACIAADVVSADGQKTLCINGEVVSLVAGDPPTKIFKDSIDRLTDISVKNGLFKKSVTFAYNGTTYSLVVKNGKTVIDYFKLLAEEQF